MPNPSRTWPNQGRIKHDRMSRYVLPVPFRTFSSREIQLLQTKIWLNGEGSIVRWQAGKASSAYLSLIRPILEYGAIVWDPHLKKDIDKLERVQRSAARFIAGDFRTTTPGFVTKILDQNQLPTLQSRREDLCLTFFHKIVQGLVPAIPPQTFLTPQQTGRLRRTTRDQNFSYQSTDNYIRNNKKCFKVPQSKTNQFKFSFLPRTTISWNSLPDTVVEHQTTEGFKGALARQRK